MVNKIILNVFTLTVILLCDIMRNFVMPSVILLNDIILTVLKLSVIVLLGIVLNIITLSIVILNVTVLNVAAPSPTRPRRARNLVSVSVVLSPTQHHADADDQNDRRKERQEGDHRPPVPQGEKLPKSVAFPAQS
jgi:hypothetical protein